MKKILLISFVSLMNFGLVSCSNENLGTVSGAAIGGLVGNQFGSGSGRAFATGVGVIIGAGIGNTIGRNMDDAQSKATYAALHANRVETVYENNGSDYYRVEPVETYYEANNSGNRRQCREYNTVINVGGKEQRAYGKACLMPDGDWKIVA